MLRIGLKTLMGHLKEINEGGVGTRVQINTHKTAAASGGVNSKALTTNLLKTVSMCSLNPKLKYNCLI